MQRAFVSFLVLLFSISFLPAQQVVRGPYLQKATFDAITVCWRTDVPTQSRVRFGSGPGALSQTVVDTALVTDHKVVVPNLQPFTDYFYAVGTPTGDLAGDDPEHYFNILPPQGSTGPVRIWAIGDFGKDNNEKIQVRESYLDEAAQTGKADVWLWLGDNAYNDGTDSEYQQKVFDGVNGFHKVFPNTVFWPTPGNHDYNSVNLLAPPPQHTGPYFDIVDVPTQGESGGLASGYELYYSFDYGPVHFMSLNSELTTWTATTGNDLTDWITADLQANTLPFVVAYFHQPPHSKGSHDSDDFWELPMRFMRNNIMPLLEDQGVDVILAGHSHVYERSYLVKGFYANNSSDFNPSTHAVSYTSGTDSIGETYYKYTSGPDANQGTVYGVVGNSGSKDSDPDLDHPMMYANYGCDTCIGSLLMDVAGNRLDAFYLTAHGDKIDAFTIIKTAPVGQGEAFEPAIDRLQVRPNPFGESMTWTLDLQKGAEVSARLMDIRGKVVWEEGLGKQASGTVEKQIPTANLANGLYVLLVEADGDVAQARVVKGR